MNNVINTLAYLFSPKLIRWVLGIIFAYIFIVLTINSFIPKVMLAPLFIDILDYIKELFITIVALYGLYYTITGYFATFNNYQSLSDFYKRAGDIINRARSRVWIIYYTPNVGIISSEKETITHKYKEFMDKLENARDNKSIEFKSIFLDPVSIHTFYNMLEVNDDLRNTAIWRDCKFYSDTNNKFKSECRFSEYDDFSTTFIIADGEALVMNPLYLPEKFKNKYTGKVTFIGYTTNNTEIVGKLEEIFNIYWDEVNDKYAHYQEILSRISFIENVGNSNNTPENIKANQFVEFLEKI